MSVDLIRYDLLVQDALRGVVGRVLTDVARDGLPGEHHLYLAFDTCAPGVRISPRLKERYPEEMTIVLQHQFWDLIVTDQFFEVGLSFNGIPERLHVPFDALKGFFDPSVKFGLQFEPMEELEEEDETGDDAPAPTPIGEGRPTSVPSTRPARLAEVKPGTDADSEPGKPAAKPASRAAGARSATAKPAAAGREPAEPGAAPAAKSPKPASASPVGSKPSDGDSSGAAGPHRDVDEEEPKDGGSGGAQVVRLDAFRKK